MKPSRSTALLVRLAALCGLVIPAGVGHSAQAQGLPNVDSCIKRLDPDDRARLADLGLATERVRFSGREIPSAGLQEPLSRGRELLESLDASAPR